MINLDYKDKRSIHEQIVGGIKELIIGGVLQADEKLPSVRDLSMNLTVNPNTVQKAYRQLETDGYIYSVQGKGNFVASVPEEKDFKKIEGLYEEIKRAVCNLMYLGEEKDGIINLVNNIYSQKGDEE